MKRTIHMGLGMAMAMMAGAAPAATSPYFFDTERNGTMPDRRSSSVANYPTSRQPKRPARKLDRLKLKKAILHG